jgi:hypothetical protein
VYIGVGCQRGGSLARQITVSIAGFSVDSKNNFRSPLTIFNQDLIPVRSSGIIDGSNSVDSGEGETVWVLCTSRLAFSSAVNNTVYEYELVGCKTHSLLYHHLGLFPFDFSGVTAAMSLWHAQLGCTPTDDSQVARIRWTSRSLARPEFERSRLACKYFRLVMVRAAPIKICAPRSV